MAEDALINQILHDTYRVEKLLAGGGMGDVYEAAHIKLSRKYALKVVSAEAAKNPAVVERFLTSWSTLSAMNHRHIAEATDYFEMPDGRPVLVMELLTGETLAHRIKYKGKVEVAEAALILRQVASGLQTAHKKRVVHADLRPEKILFCKTREKDDFVKIVGFGATIGASGNHQYLAPELVEFDGTGRLDHRIDEYSVAAMLFEMLTGRPPLHADDAAALRTKIKDEEPPKLREVRADIPEPVEYVIAKSLRKEPQRRYPSMGALSREFASTLAM